MLPKGIEKKKKNVSPRNQQPRSFSNKENLEPGRLSRRHETTGKVKGFPEDAPVRAGRALPVGRIFTRPGVARPLTATREMSIFCKATC